MRKVKKRTVEDRIREAVLDMPESEWRGIVQVMRLMFEHDKVDHRKFPPLVRKMMGRGRSEEDWDTVRETVTGIRKNAKRREKYRRLQEETTKRRDWRRYYMRDYRRRRTLANTGGNAI